MSDIKIKEMLNKHAAWLRGDDGGEQAILQRADLQDANLRGASLRGASLRGADLRGASLLGASLLGASLQGADLRGADLQDTILRGAELQDANLRGTSLLGASLQGADLRGADLDYSCWPLWCGSLDVKIDKRIFCQLAYHLCRTIVDDEDCKAAQRALYPLANQFHRVDECGRLQVEEAETHD